MRQVLLAAVALMVGVPAVAQPPQDIAALLRRNDAGELMDRIAPRLKKDLKKAGLEYGAPIYVRIFKESRELELWLQSGTRFQKFRTYPICEMSGVLGPKLERGDDQAPEGFYSVTHDWMWPYSDFHLAFNIRYPNDYDKSLSRTGSSIMVHGGCSSSGCFAMTDEKIEEIYTLAAAALIKGQSEFSVHVFPFHMTDKNLARHKNSRWRKFWANLKDGYDIFDKTGMPPTVAVLDKQYVFSTGTELAGTCQAATDPRCGIAD